MSTLGRSVEVKVGSRVCREADGSEVFLHDLRVSISSMNSHRFCYEYEATFSAVAESQLV